MIKNQYMFDRVLSQLQNNLAQQFAT
jgi:hypothetical protein